MKSRTWVELISLDTLDKGEWYLQFVERGRQIEEKQSVNITRLRQRMLIWMSCKKRWVNFWKSYLFCFTIIIRILNKTLTLHCSDYAVNKKQVRSESRIVHVRFDKFIAYFITIPQECTLLSSYTIVLWHWYVQNKLHL